MQGNPDFLVRYKHCLQAFVGRVQQVGYVLYSTEDGVSIYFLYYTRTVFQDWRHFVGPADLASFSFCCQHDKARENTAFFVDFNPKPH